MTSFFAPYRAFAPLIGLLAGLSALSTAAVADTARLYAQAAEAYDGGDSARAAQLWQRAANAGDVDAMTALGALLEEGDGVSRDRARAHGWYIRAAAGGEPHAMVLLALERFAQNPTDEQGRALMRQAASLNHEFAKRRIAALSGDARDHSDDSIGDHQ